MRYRNRNRQNRLHRHPNRSRRGGVTLEMILNFPIWMITLLAVIQFGQLEANLQDVSQASRVGAEEAVLTDLNTTADNDPVPADIVNAVKQQLQTTGIIPLAASSPNPYLIIVQHNVQYISSNPTDPSSTHTLYSESAPYICDPPTEALPDPSVYGPAVRVTVCVRMDRLTPNLLNAFGYDISTDYVRQSTTFPYQR
jgi:hypothetical protein